MRKWPRIPPDLTTAKRRPSRDEVALWRRTMSGVVTMHGECIPVSGESAPPAVVRPEHRPLANPHPPPVLPRSPLPELTHGHAPGLERQMSSRLKKGRVVIEGRIDLHGHSQDQARRALDAFIAGAAAAGRRCVLVITGKGSGRDDGTGVLRRVVPWWLNVAPNRERVLAFSYAAPRDGGEGALYVLLRRQRR